MIYKNRKELSANIPGLAVAALYKGVVVVWEVVNSCFGKGYWINEKPWNNKDGWKNK